MLLYGLASRDLDEVIDFYDSPEAAARALRDVLQDEPDVITTMSETAVALPENTFDGPNDSRWEFDATSGGYAKVR